jgi:uncharacterized membrane protein YdbT with pleckstrin-like domain
MEENPYQAPNELPQVGATHVALTQRFIFSVGLLLLVIVFVAFYVERTEQQVFLWLLAIFLAVLALCIAIVTMRQRL